jgi:branched-chain amino acid transport system substrate-binding protein
MKRNSIIIFSILIISLSIYYYSNMPDAEDNLVKIGIIAPLSGEGSTYGASMKRGFDLAMQNESNIKLIYEDSHFESKLAISAIEKLISIDNVKIIYGEAASGVTASIAPIADKNKVILFSSIASSDALQNVSDYFFRNVPRNNIQGKTMAEYVFNALNIKSAAIFNENDEYGVNLSKSFEDTFQKMGGQITNKETYDSKDSDFKTQLGKIKKADVKAVFIPGNYEESAQILKQAKELNLQCIFLGGDGSYSPKLFEIAGSASNNFHCAIMNVDTTNNYYKDFLKKFTLKYNHKPDVYDAYAYEAGMILKECLSINGNNVEKIKNYLYNHQFNSLTGNLKFDTDGEVLRKYGIVVVKNELFKTIR